jgi:hypothetical protein
MHFIPLRNPIETGSVILDMGAKTLITRAIISTNTPQESGVWTKEVSNGI